jgi:hypothetical protein
MDDRMLRRTAHQRVGKTTAGASPCDLLDYRCENQCVSDQQAIHTTKAIQKRRSDQDSFPEDSGLLSCRSPW